MIIECVGLPGSGKSTLAGRLREIGFCKEVPRSPGHSFALLFVTRHLRFTVMWMSILVRESLRTHTGSLFRFKCSVFLNTAARLQYAREFFLKNDVVILEEGMLQRVLSLYESKEDEVRLEKLLRRTPQADCMISTAYTGEIHKPKLGTMRVKKGEAYAISWMIIAQENYARINRILKKEHTPVCSFVWSEKRDSFQETLVCLQQIGLK